ncbi:RNA polymerase sigma factor SigJ [Cohnella sp. 56]|uniref:RNA polymerase sigma factor SigJ n=1 Tax=Cohnella sp. 56 TaxID=3113722 RepID=UPI0030E8C482
MTEWYERHRGLLFTLAYQLTGSAADAEDVVQDVFVKACLLEPDRLADPKAYLCKMTTNRSLDLVRSARRRRETYVGEWLPEPIPTPDDETFEAVARGELLSYAMLVLLERLTPSERTVFVLREAFGFDYAGIAELAGKTEANCRKLHSRAKSKLGLGPAEPVRPEEAGEAWVRRFLAALESGSADSVVALLAEDVVAISDGGGQAAAAIHPIETPSRVMRFLTGLARKFMAPGEGMTFALADINGQTGLTFSSAGVIDTVVLLHVEGGAVRGLYFIRNPDKLRRF